MLYAGGSPQLPAQFFGLAEFAAGALDSLDVDHVALLSYRPKDQSHEPWIFAAVHAHGKWATSRASLSRSSPRELSTDALPSYASGQHADRGHPLPWTCATPKASSSIQDRRDPLRPHHLIVRNQFNYAAEPQALQLLKSPNGTVQRGAISSQSCKPAPDLWLRHSPNSRADRTAFKRA